MRIAGLVVGVLGSIGGFIGAIVALLIGGIGGALGAKGAETVDHGCIRGTRSLNCRTGRRCSIYGQAQASSNLDARVGDRWGYRDIRSLHPRNCASGHRRRVEFPWSQRNPKPAELMGGQVLPFSVVTGHSSQLVTPEVSAILQRRLTILRR